MAFSEDMAKISNSMVNPRGIYSGVMPELPEVETVANGVHARVHGQRIVRVWTSGKPQTFKTPESEIAETLTGKRD